MRFPNGYPKNHICKRCGGNYLANSPRQKYCGSRKEKTGCAYEIRKGFLREQSRKRWKKIEYKQYQKKYQRKWKKRHPKLVTLYRERRKEKEKEWRAKNKEYLREQNKKWRKENIDKILFKNRQRLLRLKNIGGKHTYIEWLRLKKRFNYCCAMCGIPEEMLERKWAGTQFTKLTQDHIIPIEKWNKWIKYHPEIKYKCNDIENIQPACISCNSKKRDKLFFEREKEIIVFTNGVFDLVHSGHIHLLKEAKKLGDILVVGLNSDKSATKIKRKPIKNEEQRKEILESIKYVDKVIIFDELNPFHLIKKIKPDILVKGGDYSRETVIGHKFVESYGGRVVIIPTLKGFSTSNLLNKMQNRSFRARKKSSKKNNGYL